MNSPNDPKKQKIADDMKSKANKASEQAKAKGEEMKTQGKEQMGQQQHRAAGTMDQVAEATEAAARELDQQDQPALSHYVTEIAEGISSLSDNLRNKNTDELIHEASNLARRNPGLFLLGSVAVGFGVSRIAKARPPESEFDSDWENYYGHQEDRGYYEREEARGYGAESGAHTGASASPSTGATTTGRTKTGARDTGVTPTPGSSTTGSTGSSSPTHASTSYLPEDRPGTQNPGNPTPPTNSGR